MNGTNEESKKTNAFLSLVRSKLNEHYRNMLETNKLITPEAIKNAYFGNTEKGKTIVEVFKYHTDQMKELIASYLKILEKFMNYKFYCQSHKFILFFYFLMSELNN